MHGPLNVKFDYTIPVHLWTNKNSDISFVRISRVAKNFSFQMQVHKRIFKPLALCETGKCIVHYQAFLQANAHFLALLNMCFVCDCQSGLLNWPYEGSYYLSCSK
jgi:hypothetical protein